MDLYGFNILDILIILVFLFYAIEGYAIGFKASLLDFLSFVFSFLFALKFYAFFGSLLVNSFSISRGFSNAIGFFLGAIILEFVLSIFLRRISSREKTSGSLSHILGIIPGFLSALILLSFMLTLIFSFPLSPVLKNFVSQSKIGSLLISKTARFDKTFNEVFSGAVNETLNFLTINPQSNETVKLNYKVSKFSADPKGEKEMFNLINTERKSAGLNTLIFDDRLRDLGRVHCGDMFSRGYFSHYSPEGISPFDRIAKANISYSFAGENLALSPNVSLAMQGLMQSEGHRKNILSSDFGRIGIGVIDGGIHGEMFCQEFTD